MRMSLHITASPMRPAATVPTFMPSRSYERSTLSAMFQPPYGGGADWLIKPFTAAYARTKIRAWALRTACQWMSEVQQRRRAGAQARGSRPMAQKGNRKRRSSENVISTDNSDLLWMYCREIAPFETPTFRDKAGELIARATSTSSETRLQSASENI